MRTGGAPAAAGGLVEPAAEGGHVHVEGLGGAGPVLVPDVGHERLPAERGAGVGGQPGQQVELLGPQRNLPPAEQAAARGRVDGERADRVHRLRPAGPGRSAAEVGPDPGPQLGEPERLGQVVVRAGLQADHDVHLVPARGEHDQHAAGLAHPQLPAHVDAVEVGQPEVEQHQVELGQRRLPQRRPPAAGPGHLVSLGGQPGLQQRPDRLVVLDHQQPAHRPSVRTALLPAGRFAGRLPDGS